MKRHPIKMGIDLVVLTLMFACALPVAFCISVFVMATELSDAWTEWFKKDSFR